MARNKFMRGSIAYQIFNVVDSDVARDASHHHAELTSLENSEKIAVQQSIDIFTGKVRQKRNAVQDRIARRTAKRGEQIKELRHREAISDLWRSNHIQERMWSLSVPPIMRLLIYLVILVIDVVVFAVAWTNAFNNDDTIEYVTGGIVGVVVFAVSLVAAYNWKRHHYTIAQIKLKEELAEEGADPELLNSLRVSDQHEFGLIVTTAVFALLILGGVVIRLSGQDSGGPGAAMIMCALPLIGFVVEYVIKDPSEVARPRMTLVDWWQSRRLTSLNRKLEMRVLITEKRINEVTEKYSFERATLDSLHDVHGFSPRSAES